MKKSARRAYLENQLDATLRKHGVAVMKNLGDLICVCCKRQDESVQWYPSENLGLCPACETRCNQGEENKMLRSWNIQKEAAPCR